MLKDYITGKPLDLITEEDSFSDLSAGVDELIDSLSKLEVSKAQGARLLSMVQMDEIDINQEVLQQYYLLKSLQKDLVNKSNKAFIVDATPTQVSSMLSQVNSFFTLYLRSKKDFDLQTELLQLRNGIVKAIETLPAENQEAFIKELEAKI